MTSPPRLQRYTNADTRILASMTMVPPLSSTSSSSSTSFFTVIGSHVTTGTTTTTSTTAHPGRHHFDHNPNIRTTNDPSTTTTTNPPTTTITTTNLEFLASVATVLLQQQQQQQCCHDENSTTNRPSNMSSSNPSLSLHRNPNSHGHKENPKNTTTNPTGRWNVDAAPPRVGCSSHDTTTTTTRSTGTLRRMIFADRTNQMTREIPKSHPYRHHWYHDDQVPLSSQNDTNQKDDDPNRVVVKGHNDQDQPVTQCEDDHEEESIPEDNLGSMGDDHGCGDTTFHEDHDDDDLPVVEDDDDIDSDMSHHYHPTDDPIPDPPPPTRQETALDTTAVASTTNATASLPYYMDRHWVPTTKPTATTAAVATTTTTTTKCDPRRLPKQPPQISPNTIRYQLRQYMIDHPEQRKTKLLSDFGVNSNSFRKFMNPHHYKDQWRGVENGTYWAAARYLEAERVHPNRTNKSVVLPPLAPTTSPTKTSNHKSKKRKYSTSTSTRSNANRRKGRSSPPLPTAPKRYKKSHREDAIQYMTSIQAMIVPSTWPNIVGSDGDSMVQHRTQMIQKIKSFLDEPGVSKTNFCFIALNGVNRKSLEKLFHRHQCDDQNLTDDTFHRAAVFFEKKRIFDNGMYHRAMKLGSPSEMNEHPTDGSLPPSPARPEV